jgi:hypothetical protein
MQRNVVIVGLWRSRISGLTDYFLGETRPSDISLFGGRYQVEHPEASPESIEASKDFVRCIAFGVEGQYDDPMACMSTVVQMYKNFTGGWQWTNHPKIPDNVTLSTSKLGAMASNTQHIYCPNIYSNPEKDNVIIWIYQKTDWMIPLCCSVYPYKDDPNHFTELKIDKVKESRNIVRNIIDCEINQGYQDQGVRFLQYNAKIGNEATLVSSECEDHKTASESLRRCKYAWENMLEGPVKYYSLHEKQLPDYIEVGFVPFLLCKQIAYVLDSCEHVSYFFASAQSILSSYRHVKFYNG